MKKTIVILLILFVATTNFMSAQSVLKQDEVLGEWFTSDKKGVILIYKTGNKYFGKVIKGNDENAEKFDVNNPDPSKRKQTRVGLVILKNFVYDDEEWEDGTIYDPNNGKTYSCVMELDGPNKLEITGYIGFTFFGRTEVWTRKLK